MATPDRYHDMLATIFSFFLGLMVLALIGVGVSTAIPTEYGLDSSHGIVLVVCATIVMAVALALADRFHLISNGLLLGGIFTMLYGTGAAVLSGDEQGRFIVAAAALAITLGLGYMRFLRPQQATQTAEAVTPAEEAELDTAPVPALAERIAKLEQCMSGAAAALGADEPSAGTGD